MIETEGTDVEFVTKKLHAIFGEDRVDIQTQDTSLVITVHFPELIMENSSLKKHVIRDLYVKLILSVNFSGEIYRTTSPLLGARTTFTAAEICHGFVHSHLHVLETRLKVYDENKNVEMTRWDSFCTGGSGEGMGNILSRLSYRFTREDFARFASSLEDFVSWESKSGGPYVNYEDIPKDYIPKDMFIEVDSRVMPTEKSSSSVGRTAVENYIYKNITEDQMNKLSEFFKISSTGISNFPSKIEEVKKILRDITKPLLKGAAGKAYKLANLYHEFVVLEQLVGYNSITLAINKIKRLNINYYLEYEGKYYKPIKSSTNIAAVLESIRENVTLVNETDSIKFKGVEIQPRIHLPENTVSSTLHPALINRIVQFGEPVLTDIDILSIIKSLTNNLKTYFNNHYDNFQEV